MYVNDLRAQAMVKMWMGRAATSIAAEHFCSPVTVRRWWKDFKRTGKIAHQNLKRGQAQSIFLALVAATTGSKQAEYMNRMSHAAI